MDYEDILRKLAREEKRLRVIVRDEGMRTANGARAGVLLDGVAAAYDALAVAIHKEARTA